MHDLGLRTGVADLRSLGAVLIQADKFGSSIAQALRVQSESMRTRRRQMAEEKAAKTAVKLLFPLVLFIFPGIFVVLVGPAAITMVRQMFPKMPAGEHLLCAFSIFAQVSRSDTVRLKTGMPAIVSGSAEK